IPHPPSSERLTCNCLRIVSFPGVDTSMGMDVNPNPCCSRIMDPHMALSSILGLDITVAPLAAQGIQISMALVAARSLDTNMVTDELQSREGPGKLRGTFNICFPAAQRVTVILYPSVVFDAVED
ncbi:hypothetical protein STEG23_022442, partial [Scotinomys teguina]